MDKILLVECQGNWSDEIDYYGFALITESAWEEHLQLIEDFFFEKDNFSLHIGSNQEVYFEDELEYERIFKTQEVSQADASILMRQFNLSINDTGRKISSYKGICTFKSF
jgi:hypothetical protein